MTWIDWRKDDIRKWLQEEQGNIYYHLILSRACDGEEMKKYKSIDSYDILPIWVVPVGKFFNSPSKIEFFEIKNKVRLSQKINSDFRNKWVFCDMVGTTLTGGYSCMPGNSKTCSHVRALLHRCLKTRLSTPPPPLFSYLYNGF